MKEYKHLRRRSLNLIIALASMICVLIAFGLQRTASAEALPPKDAAAIRSRMQTAFDLLDSDIYEKTVSWKEHIVLAYRLGAGRDPSVREFFLLEKLQEHPGLKRSAVLSYALRNEQFRPSWEKCREFLDRVNLSGFKTDAYIKNLVAELSAAPAELLKEDVVAAPMGDRVMPDDEKNTFKESPVPYTQYEIYFGNLHAHSELSDGKGSPLEAYTYARDFGDLDFFSLSDHGEQLNLWPWEDRWEQLVSAANATYMPGVFVSLWGFEWSSVIYGHINVLNTDDYTDSVSMYSIDRLYTWIGNRPAAFGQYNHPGEYDDLNSEFDHLKLYPEAVNQMVGIETLNGGDDFDIYYYGGSWSSAYSYWDEGNRNGWYLGPLGNQDNHHRDWGTRNEFRTAILAQGLTREAVVDAITQRRFYATEDKNLYLDFRCQGFPMGARLPKAKTRFKVTAWDGNGDTFQEVRLYRNGEQLITKNVAGSAIDVSFDDWGATTGQPAYYYVIVRQSDDNDGDGRNDEAISSPIWIAESEPDRPGRLPSIPLLLLDEP